jgi:hypothetical protein
MTARGSDGSIPPGLLAGDAMCTLAASVAGLSQAPHELPQARREQPRPSAEERSAEAATVARKRAAAFDRS